MMIDTDVQLWLELQQNPPAIIVPFVKSSTARRLDYRIRTRVVGGHGQSNITQGGSIQIPANVPTALTRLSLHYLAQDTCDIDIELAEQGTKLKRQRFECP